MIRPAENSIRERRQKKMEKPADRYDEVISLNTDIYPLESIQLAACGFLDEGFFYLFPAGNGAGLDKVNVAIKARDGEKIGIEELTGRFTNELNRQSLRIALGKVNRSVRTQIVGRALASIFPPEPESEESKESK